MNTQQFTEEEMNELFLTNEKAACIFDPHWVMKHKHIESLIKYNPSFICEVFPDNLMTMNNQECVDLLAEHNFVWLLFNHTELAINRYPNKVFYFISKTKDILPLEQYNIIYHMGIEAFKAHNVFNGFNNNDDSMAYAYRPTPNFMTPPQYPY